MAHPISSGTSRISSDFTTELGPSVSGCDGPNHVFRCVSSTTSTSTPSPSTSTSESNTYSSSAQATATTASIAATSTRTGESTNTTSSQSGSSSTSDAFDSDTMSTSSTLWEDGNTASSPILSNNSVTSNTIRIGSSTVSPTENRSPSSTSMPEAAPIENHGQPNVARKTAAISGLVMGIVAVLILVAAIIIVRRRKIRQRGSTSRRPPAVDGEGSDVGSRLAYSTSSSVVHLLGTATNEKYPRLELGRRPDEVYAGSSGSSLMSISEGSRYETADSRSLSDGATNGPFEPTARAYHGDEPSRSPYNGAQLDDTVSRQLLRMKNDKLDRRLGRTSPASVDLEPELVGVAY